MVNVNIKKYKSYEDRDLLDEVEIQQGDTVRNFEYQKDELLKTVSKTHIKPMNSRRPHSRNVILPQDCFLDVEVLTPKPDISVEISDRHLIGDDLDVEYASWTFDSRLSFENWIENNNLRVCD